MTDIISNLKSDLASLIDARNKHVTNQIELKNALKTTTFNIQRLSGAIELAQNILKKNEEQINSISKAIASPAVHEVNPELEGGSGG